MNYKENAGELIGKLAAFKVSNDAELDRIKKLRSKIQSAESEMAGDIIIEMHMSINSGIDSLIKNIYRSI
jgi:hypothetical protein